jgi:hypothetical protein
MTFKEVLAQVSAWLQQDKRVSYLRIHVKRTLSRRRMGTYR